MLVAKFAAPARESLRYSSHEFNADMMEFMIYLFYNCVFTLHRA